MSGPAHHVVALLGAEKRLYCRGVVVAKVVFAGVDLGPCADAVLIASCWSMRGREGHCPRVSFA